MAAPRFISKSDRRGLVPIWVDGAQAVLRSDELHRVIAQRCGRDIANLFAEPVLSADGSSISWYAEAPGDPQPLVVMDSEKRRAPEALLRSQLSRLAPLLSDPEIGPLLSAALYVASAQDILVIDGVPLITNWGLLPESVPPQDMAALAAHFAETTGRFASFPAPRLGAASQTAGSASTAGVPEIKTDTPTSPGSEAALAASGRPWQAWRAPVIAVAAAAALLLFLSWPHVLRAWYGSDYSGALQRAKELNEQLSQKISEIEKGLEEAVCKGGGLSGAPNLPPGDPNQIAPPKVEVPPGVKTPTSLNDALNSSVVLVLAVSDEKGNEGLGMGSGFFVGPKTIVTNFHVVEKATKVAVVNKMLGKLTPAQVRAHTPGTKDADFAVLEIPADGGAGLPMTLSQQAELMENAVIVGYPGVAVERDARLRKLLVDGDITAIPGLSASPTFISQTLLDQEPPLLGVNSQINHGNSGGPLIDYCGRVLGLNTMFVQGDDGDRANYAQASRGLMTFLDSVQVPYPKSDDKCGQENHAPSPSPAPQSAPVPPSGASK
jgi:S1-C subfamily serine protease